MKKIFLLLTITLAQAQVCLTNSEALTSQFIAENQNQAKDKKPQTWREYCDNKIASTKNGLNSGYKWVKTNPGKSITIAAIILAVFVPKVFNYYKKIIKQRDEEEKRNLNYAMELVALEHEKKIRHNQALRDLVKEVNWQNILKDEYLPNPNS